ncbi:unnamed protein product [Bursaphelenchus xylophilus]|uniref:(pine wood nematode) hypothetical protein n=1 Tax=Bursaphelenchus xylophilus TaxID=6326 RepID=A0A1I7S093_BURXY|nr:unnamed protein product [Bursaphelenchus xylophilus]CAG9108941.1 unnamed protein product [Bursaphelenchus xylophilus]
MTESPPETAKTWREMYRLWPKWTFFIILQEFFERFSYYGIMNTLMLYFLNVVNFQRSDAVIATQFFSITCYTSPFLGSILADGYIGKFKTIFILSVVYTLGQALLTYSATFNPGTAFHPGVDLLALFIIGIGTGGIKPCVSTFGGDQFDPKQLVMISLFFSIFYFSINVGATITFLVSPIVRTLPCLGKDSCYPLCFGIPTLLMAVATICFGLGSVYYIKKPPTNNVFKQVYDTIKEALRNYRKSSNKCGRFLDYSLDEHDCNKDKDCRQTKDNGSNGYCAKKVLVSDIRTVIKVLVIFIPAGIYFSLNAMRGAKWILQALEMDPNITDHFQILPDQLSVIYPLLVLVLIPFLNGVVYPTVDQFFKVTPLRKMVAGTVVAGFAFWIAAVVQSRIDAYSTPLPSIHQSFVTFTTNIRDCRITINSTVGTFDVSQWTENLQQSSSESFLRLVPGSNNIEVYYGGENCAYKNDSHEYQPLELAPKGMYNILISPKKMIKMKLDPRKTTQANGAFSQAYVVLNAQNISLALCRQKDDDNATITDCNPTKPNDYYFFKPMESESDINSTQFEKQFVKQGRWHLFLVNNSEHYPMKHEFSRFKAGGVYLTMLEIDQNREAANVSTLNYVMDNQIHLLWQAPQIFLSVLAECLFQITGNEFAFTQAAPSMKAIIQAFWLSTIAFGDVVVIVIEKLGIFSRDQLSIWELLFYATMVHLDALVLAYLANFHYTYRVEYTESRRKKSKLERKISRNDAISMGMISFPMENEHIEEDNERLAVNG